MNSFYFYNNNDAIVVIVGDLSNTLTGGCVCVMNPDEVVDVVIPEEYSNGKYFIGVDKAFAAYIGEDRLRVILSHEEGHIVLGHMTNGPKPPEEYASLPVHEIIRKEKEADAHSVKIHGAKACIAALRDSAKYLEEVEPFKLNPELREGLYAFIELRIEAIQDAM